MSRMDNSFWKILWYLISSRSLSSYSPNTFACQSCRASVPPELSDSLTISSCRSLHRSFQWPCCNLQSSCTNCFAKMAPVVVSLVVMCQLLLVIPLCWYLHVPPRDFVHTDFLNGGCVVGAAIGGPVGKTCYNFSLKVLIGTFLC
jgi:hypothetical protein